MMKQPGKGVPAQQFKLRNSSGKDVAFEGWLLGEVSNQKDYGTDSWKVEQRWKERAIYQTKGGAIVCHKLGRSTRSGEVDRGDVLIVQPHRDKFVSLCNPDTGMKTETTREWLAREEMEDAVVEYFRGDSLAKDLFDQVGLDDVERIE